MIGKLVRACVHGCKELEDLSCKSKVMALFKVDNVLATNPRGGCVGM